MTEYYFGSHLLRERNGRENDDAYVEPHQPSSLPPPSVTDGTQWYEMEPTRTESAIVQAFRDMKLPCKKIFRRHFWYTVYKAYRLYRAPPPTRSGRKRRWKHIMKDVFRLVMLTNKIQKTLHACADDI